MSGARPAEPWIKICGMTTAEAVDAALAARVDAIGFVFSPSSRQLAPAAASRLAAPARGRVLCVAVTRHPDQPLLDEIVAVFKPDLWQSDWEDIARLRVPQALAVLPVLRSSAAGPAARARSTRPLPLPPRLLYEGPVSGSGETCDWSSARELAPSTELILAGGLDAASVGEAIATVEPFGVDVSSGVEESPGIKSPQKIMRFVAAARARTAVRRGAPIREENLK